MTKTKQKLLIYILLALFAFSCTPKPVVKTEKIIPKRPIEHYIPWFTDFIIKNNASTQKLFRKKYKASLKYEFFIKKESYHLSLKPEKEDSFSINHHFLTPKRYYHVGLFPYDLSEFDFFYKDNLFRIVSLDKELILFSTGDQNHIGELPKDIDFLQHKKSELILHEEYPHFYHQAIAFIQLPYQFQTVRSYILLKYKEKLTKNHFQSSKKENAYLFILTLSDMEELLSFKKLIAKNHHEHRVNGKDIYSNKAQTQYIIFSGDKIIFTKHINILELLDNINKIPLTSIHKSPRNHGYIITKNRQYLDSLFPLFNKIDFHGKIIYYFYDYQLEDDHE